MQIISDVFFSETTCLSLIHSATIIWVNTVFSGRGVEINFIIHSQRKYENLATLGSPVFITWPKKRREVREFVFC